MTRQTPIARSLAAIRRGVAAPFVSIGAYLGGNSPPIHEAAGYGRRSVAYNPSNPGAVASMLYTQNALRTKSRDIARRNPWAHSALESFVANAVGTGIKPQFLCADDALRSQLQKLWLQWSTEADSTGLTDFYGVQALAVRAMIEGGEVLIRLRPRLIDDGLVVPLQIQVLEPEHLPLSLNYDVSAGDPTGAVAGNCIRSGIEFNKLGQRVAYHVYTAHPEDGALAPMSSSWVNTLLTTRIPASEMLHMFRPLRPGQIRGEPWFSRALIKLEELDQYDDAELVRKKTAAMFAGFITRNNPEDPLLGEGAADANGIAIGGLEPGTMQILEPGEDVKFSEPADVGSSYSEFLRVQFRAVAAAIGVTYEQLTGDLSGVNYSSIRAGLVEFRRRIEPMQYSIIVHQLCRPILMAWMDAAVNSGAVRLPGYALAVNRRNYQECKWVAQGWAWVDPQKEIAAINEGIRNGLMSRSEGVSARGEDSETVDKEIAADNARADALKLKYDSDSRWPASPVFNPVQNPVQQAAPQ